MSVYCLQVATRTGYQFRLLEAQPPPVCRVAKMPVTIVSRFKGNQDHTPTVKEAAAILKRHGAMSVRGGRCLVGGYAGEVVVATTFADWTTYGNGMQGLMADADWQKFQAGVASAFELQDRSIIASEDF